jgi:hypothetical protein
MKEHLPYTLLRNQNGGEILMGGAKDSGEWKGDEFMDTY